MPRVSGVMRRRASSISIQYVYGSQSAKTGRWPQRRIASKQLTIVNEGRMISEPTGSSSADTASSRATVPLQTAIPCRRPQYAAHADSKRSIYLPAEEIQPLRRQSSTYFSSLPGRRGSLTAIISPVDWVSGNALLTLRGVAASIGYNSGDCQDRNWSVGVMKVKRPVFRPAAGM